MPASRNARQMSKWETLGVTMLTKSMRSVGRQGRLGGGHLLVRVVDAAGVQVELGAGLAVEIGVA